MKEFFRKRLVSLKRTPQIIPQLMLGICLLVYMLNMSKISDTTAYLSGTNMGFVSFITTLLSILVMVCAINAFPKRKKVRIPMLVLIFVMIAGMIACDVYYMGRIMVKYNDPNSGIDFGANAYIIKAYWVIFAHVICLGVTALFFALLPLYTKLLRKINTAIKVEGSAETMAAIEIEEKE